jgi:hypothetical protein
MKDIAAVTSFLMEAADNIQKSADEHFKRTGHILPTDGMTVHNNSSKGSVLKIAFAEKATSKKKKR